MKSDIARPDPINFEDISIRRCIAEDCPKIFIPVRSDHVFCSKRCAKRVWAQRQ